MVLAVLPFGFCGEAGLRGPPKTSLAEDLVGDLIPIDLDPPNLDWAPGPGALDLRGVVPLPPILDCSFDGCCSAVGPVLGCTVGLVVFLGRAMEPGRASAVFDMLTGLLEGDAVLSG